MGANTMDINNENFKEKVINSKKPVLVDLWAEWCGPCKMIAPAIDEIARQYKDHVEVGKINVDDCPDLATELAVMNIPTLIFFKNGKEAGRSVGVNTKQSIEKKIKEVFKI